MDKKLNGLQNPGNFCYIISTLQSLRTLLKNFFEYHNILISYYIIVSKQISIFKQTESFKLDLEVLRTEKQSIILKLFNELNEKNNINIFNSISETQFIFDKLIKEHIKICCLLVLRNIIYSIEDKKEQIINTINFIKLFNVCARANGVEYICNGSQNDSNEFMVILLDYLNDAVSMPKKCIVNNKKYLTYTENELNNMELTERVKIQTVQYYNRKFSKEHSYLDEELSSLILNIIKCSNCGFKQTSINSVNNIYCSIPTNMENIKLSDCLNNYFAEEELEYKCDNCKESGNNIITKRLLSVKKYLIITLKIFDYNKEYNMLTKLHNNIDYPFMLNMKNYCINNNDMYNLESIISHKGMMNYGHYYSICKRNLNWYICNDENISKINMKDVKNNNVYILIYKKKENIII